MSRSSKQRGKHPHPCGDDERKPAAGSWRPVVRFILTFLICMAMFYAITAIPWFQRSFFPAYMTWNASASAMILRVLGEDAQNHDENVLGERFSLSIRRGCDAIEPTALFCSAVIAFPALWRRRIIGLLIGIPTLLLTNLIRIVTLYFAGVYFSLNTFEAIHVDVWQPLFILLAMLGFIAWAIWATRGSKKGQPADDLA